MNELQIKESFSLTPTSLKEAMEYSELIANTDLVPNDYKKKPGNILVAIQMGAEVGLPPMQALQNIAVINGRPSIWGDAMLAIVMSAHDFVCITEVLDDESLEAKCTIQRTMKDGSIQSFVSTFSKADATTAKLWTKAGPWTQYPKRMLQMRARSFACRNAFPDRLKGLHSAEESTDLPKERDITPKEPKKSAISHLKTEPVESTPDIEVEPEVLNEEDHKIDLETVLGSIHQANNNTMLAQAHNLAAAHLELHPEDRTVIGPAYDEKYSQFNPEK